MHGILFDYTVLENEKYNLYEYRQIHYQSAGSH